MKKVYSLIILFLLTLSGFSQGPQKAVGIRGGLSSGFEYRVFSGDLSSYKVLLSTRKRGLQLTGLKEFHIPDVFDIGEPISLVYGFGAHAGFETWKVEYYDLVYPYHITYFERKTSAIAGLDALAALEYTIPQIPLVVGIEAKPYFNLFGRDFFQIQPFDFAFTVKYTF
ncbi:MAG: hypothetical protein Q8K69_12850 [Bacteroidota bacterium]|nr:hypothetical protein [Bacteroidota bacterium]